MIVYWHLFLAFFIPGIVGYGGGPAFIPLVQAEVVNKYGYLSLEEFAELLAIGNALPGPIVTKMAGVIGYDVGGWFGSFVALFASIAPSLLAMIFLLGFISKYKDSRKLKNMMILIKPTIAILLAVLAYNFFARSWFHAGAFQTVFLIILSYLFLERWKVHPAYVIVGSLIYGSIIL